MIVKHRGKIRSALNIGDSNTFFGFPLASSVESTRWTHALGLGSSEAASKSFSQTTSSCGITTITSSSSSFRRSIFVEADLHLVNSISYGLSSVNEVSVV